MQHVTEVHVEPYEPSSLKLELPPGRWDSLLETAQNFPPGGTLWHINSTSAGGGVAEMLHPMIGFAKSVGIATRWLVIDGLAYK